MRKVWHDEVWDDYLAWQVKDKKVLKKINTLLKDITRFEVAQMTAKAMAY